MAAELRSHEACAPAVRVKSARLAKIPQTGPAMNTPLSPIVSEFETEEQAASHDRWVRRKIAASLADHRPAVPHDQAMSEAAAIIAAAEQNLTRKPS